MMSFPVVPVKNEGIVLRRETGSVSPHHVRYALGKSRIHLRQKKQPIRRLMRVIFAQLDCTLNWT